MAVEPSYHDPLTFNLVGQTRALIAELPSSTPYKTKLSGALSTGALLPLLSELLAIPSLTLLIEKLFRPILFDLCARWLEVETETDAHFVALCLLIDMHEELFP